MLVTGCIQLYFDMFFVHLSLTYALKKLKNTKIKFRIQSKILCIKINMSKTHLLSLQHVPSSIPLFRRKSRKITTFKTFLIKKKKNSENYFSIQNSINNASKFHQLL